MDLMDLGLDLDPIHPSLILCTCLPGILLQLAKGCDAYMLGRRRGLFSGSIILDLLVSFVIMSSICHISLHSRI